ncbi:FlgK family flagellar hook-associated protein [Pseudaeromonas paramecii]|uniref:Flagellar hook-associated protein 1 n=1 Tax=Pseudaeromonas paramecii TaxID=2138166 RepID=A0ABP8Q4C7_9GAMM
MSTDLLGIGTSGLLGQQRLLWTAGNNISNLNTEGFTRQQTTLYTNAVNLGVGSSNTTRVLNQFAQGELWRDTSTHAYNSSYYADVAYTDKLLSDSANSAGVGIDNFFKGLHSANETPNGQSGREGVLSNIDSMLNRYSALNSQLTQQYDTANAKIGNAVNKINTLLSNINDLNTQLIKRQGSGDDGTSLHLMDQRDEQVRQLSEMLDIRTVPQDDGSLLVNMTTGQSLVARGQAASMLVVNGDPDSRETGIQLSLNKATTSLKQEVLGGSLGGMFAARDELAPTKRQLGQLAVAMADAMNQQNRLGMTLNNQLGGDIFTLPSSEGLPYAGNAGTGAVSVDFMAGEGSNVTGMDYLVTFTTANDYEIYRLDDDGKKTGSPITGTTTFPATIDLDAEGLSLNLSGAPAAGDKFLLQPTLNAAGGLSRELRVADDLALASPLKLTADSNNYGTGSIKLDGVTNTDGSSGFSSGSLDSAAPHSVTIDDSGNYVVYDGTGGVIGTAAASTGGKNLMAAIYGSPAAQTYPGFEFSIDGSVAPGDNFTLEFNTDGFSDNTNGLAMANLQNKDLVRRADSTSADNTITLNESFTALVTGVGSKVSQAKTEMTASEAKLTQSQDWYNSVSGVNLDEEASNLIKYQQAYSAAAQIVNVAKSTFDTLLNAVS